MKGRLVVLGSVVTALGVVRESRRLGLDTVLVDTQSGPAADTRLARVMVLRDLPLQEIIGLLVREGAVRPSYLIATTDEWLRVIASRRTILDDAFTKVLHPVNDVLSLCLSKARFADWCSENGLPTPYHYRITPDGKVEARDLRFPVFVRPDETLHSRPVAGIPKAAAVASMETLRELLARFRAAGLAAVVSESLLGRRLTQYSVGVVRARGMNVALTARKLRPPADLSAVGTLVEVVDRPEVERLARRTLDLMDFEGIAEVEVLADDDFGEKFLIEVNARPWLQFSLAFAAGVDILRFAVQGTQGSQQPAAVIGARWLDFCGDLYLCFNRGHGLVRTGRITPGQYLTSFSHVRAFARWDWRDPGPCLKQIWRWVASRLPGRKKRRASTESTP